MPDFFAELTDGQRRAIAAKSWIPSPIASDIVATVGRDDALHYLESLLKRCETFARSDLRPVLSDRMPHPPID